MKLIVKWIKYLFLFGMSLALISVILNKWIVSSTDDQVYNSVKEIPANKVGLVLGTNKTNRKNNLNPYFKYRMEAAAELYRNNKIEHILVSGDNSTIINDEPTDMKNYLMMLGVPSNKITLDYAGFRTFDSMVRAQEVFGQSKITIISQKFHNQRALFIANKIGIDAVGYNAKDITMSKRMKMREFLAKVKAVLDIYVLNTAPKFLGDKVVIS